MGMTRLQALAYILSWPDLVAGYNDGANNQMPEQWADDHWAAWGEKEGRRYPDDAMMCDLLRLRRWGHPDTPAAVRLVKIMERWAEEKTGAELRELWEKYQCVDALMIANDRAFAQEEAWWATISSQPWFRDFQAVPPGWLWNSKTRSWSHPRNDLIKKYGAWEVYMAATLLGFPPGPDVRVKGDPESTKLDETPMPTTTPQGKPLSAG